MWPFAEEWVLGEFFPLKNKFLQALSFLLICDLHAFTSFFCKLFPCTFTLCFMHTEFAVLQEKLSIFVEDFLAGKRIIARYVIVNRRPETSAVFSSFWFFTGCLCFLEIFAFIRRGVNRGMQSRRSVVFLGPIRRSDLKGLCHPTRMREPMKTNLKKLACLFQVLSEILEGCLYLSKSQPSFDS